MLVQIAPVDSPRSVPITDAESRIQNLLDHSYNRRVRSRAFALLKGRADIEQIASKVLRCETRYREDDVFSTAGNGIPRCKYPAPSYLDRFTQQALKAEKLFKPRPIVLSSILAGLISIYHPFSDGNGRVSRWLIANPGTTYQDCSNRLYIELRRKRFAFISLYLELSASNNWIRFLKNYLIIVEEVFYENDDILIKHFRNGE